MRICSCEYNTLQIAPIVAPIRMLKYASDLVGSLVSWFFLVQIFHVRPYFCLNEHTVQRSLIQSESPFTCLMDIYPDFLPHVPQPCTTTALIPRGISMSSCLQDRFLQQISTYSLENVSPIYRLDYV